MNPSWPTHLKVAYLTLTLVLFIGMMWAVGQWVAAPFADWVVATTSGLPVWIRAGMLISIFPIWLGLYWFRYLRHGLR